MAEKFKLNTSFGMSIEEIQALSSRGFKERQIEKHVAEFFGVKVSYSASGEIDTHYYPYVEGDKIGYKVRSLPKQFSFVGDMVGLFGQTLFQGGGKRLIITEGEIDAMAVAQASYEKYQKIYPVVSLSSATNTKPLLENRDWIRSFGEVVLCLDNDAAGQEATDKAIHIIGLDKVKICKLPLKDASDVLLKNGGNRLLQAIWDAEVFKPAGFLTKEEIWEEVKSAETAPVIPYPACMAGVNKKLRGMRLGEIVLFISGTGSGKSTLLREIILHLLDMKENNPDELFGKAGIISLEESPAETAINLSGMMLSRNPEYEDVPIDDLKVGFDKVFKDEQLMILDHQNTIKDKSIVDLLEYMCLSGCTHIFVDHITILVSEGADGLTGNEAIDKIMNDLLRVVKRHKVWIGLVSHLRKATNGGKSFEEGNLPSIDDIKGSGSIKQVSFDIIAFARDLTAEDERVRNTMLMSVLKARKTGRTGPVNGCIYDYPTGRLSELTQIESFDTL
jgi:twinkle protein